MARARILHVITLLELGGAQQNTLHTVRHLDRKRFEVGLVAGLGGILDAEAEAIPDLQLALLPSLVRAVSPAADARAFGALVRIMRARRPDIVHTHSSKAGILGRLAAVIAGVPHVVHSVHGFGFTPGQSRPVRALFLAAERLVAPSTEHFVAVSRANLTEGVRRGLFRREQVSLIRSGFPLAEFRDVPDRRAVVRAELGVADDEVLVGGVSCLKPQKDPLTFADTAATVLAQEPRVRFVLAGDGAMRGPLEGRLKTLGIADRVRLLGWRSDVPAILQAMDLFLHTSRWEGLPRVLPQAMAVGRAVVATAVDGAPEVVRHGWNGFLAPPRDVAALAAGVLRLVRDPELRRAMGERGQRVVAEFDDRLLVPEQEALYDDLLDAPARWAHNLQAAST